MSDKFFQAKSFLSYWLDAVDEHSLHSPFFFDLYTRIYNRKAHEVGNAAFERLRKKLLDDSRMIQTIDLGSGRTSKDNRIGKIAAAAMSPMKLSSFYARLIEHMKAKTIIELGTSFGINTLYLASQKKSQVTTFEGSPEIAGIANLTFQFAQASNVTLIEGNIDSTFPIFVNGIRKADFALIDANHRYEPTIRYFNLLLARIHESSVVVVDDIHYNAGMNQAWNELKEHNLVYGSADLFRCGILFFDPSLNKQHVILQV